MVPDKRLNSCGQVEILLTGIERSSVLIPYRTKLFIGINVRKICDCQKPRKVKPTKVKPTKLHTCFNHDNGRFQNNVIDYSSWDESYSSFIMIYMYNLSCRISVCFSWCERIIIKFLYATISRHKISTRENLPYKSANKAVLLEFYYLHTTQQIKSFTID